MSRDNIIKFTSNNFTPPTRTPWGGRRIVEHYKAGLDLKSRSDWHAIGETWEFSLDKSFPSLVIRGEQEQKLAKVLQREEHWLSEAHKKVWGLSSPLLLKIIDARHKLSLQVHPPLHDLRLEDNQSGKWEAWHVLTAEEGAGIYWGLKDGVSKCELRYAIEHNEDIAQCLHFEEVVEGGTYIIEPGCVHAIGEGVCVLEPQLILPNKEAQTYRLWDWKRKYDANGVQSPKGKHRELDVKMAMEFVQTDATRHPIFFDAKVPDMPNFWKAQYLIKDERMISIRIKGSGKHTISMPKELSCLCVLGGKAKVTHEQETKEFFQGETGVIAARANEIELDLHEGDCVLTWIVVG